MPLSRDPRMDRRKRILRENLPVDDESASSAPARSRTRRGAEVAEESDEPTRRRSAGYSQDVRRACQHRLVAIDPSSSPRLSDCSRCQLRRTSRSTRVALLDLRQWLFELVRTTFSRAARR